MTLIPKQDEKPNRILMTWMVVLKGKKMQLELDLPSGVYFYYVLEDGHYQHGGKLLME